MPNDDQTWPSDDCNGITLIDPVSITVRGTVLLFARQKWVGVHTLYFNVLAVGAPTGSPAEWLGWNELPMVEAGHADDPSRQSADREPQLRLCGADLITVPPIAAKPAPADAPFRVVTDGDYVSVFRRSKTGSLYLDRFILVETQAAADGSGTWALRRAWEVRYQRSGRRDVPAGPGDTLGSRNLVGEPFLEPTIELPLSIPVSGGFDVALVPTDDPDRMRWHIAGLSSDPGNQNLSIVSYPKDSSGGVDFSAGGAKTLSFPLTAAVTPTTTVPLTPVNGVAMTVFEELEKAAVSGGTTTHLRRAARLAVAVPVANEAAGLPQALAVYDFGVLPQGTIPAGPPAACQPVDGTFTDGKFVAGTGSADYPVPEQAVLATGTSTIVSMLLGRPQPSATPSLLNGADGLVHCYFAGQRAKPAGGQFLVAQYDPTVTRVEAALPWTATVGSPGTTTLIGGRPGTLLNGLAVAVADGPSPDLCTVTVDYGPGAALPAETWNGVPRDAATMVRVLDGVTSGDPADPAVQSGDVEFFDIGGKLPMTRLPVGGGEVLTLVSHRPDTPLSTVTVGPVQGETTTLTVSFSLGTAGTAQQTWADVPTGTAALAPILSGDAASAAYSYEAAAGDTPIFSLSTSAGTILLFAAPDRASAVSVQAASNGEPASCNISVTVPGSPITVPDVPRDQTGLVAALKDSQALAGVFTFVSADQVEGAVANQDATAPLNLRGGCVLFDLLVPAPAGTLSAGSPVAAIVQQRSVASSAPEPPGRSMQALTAVMPWIPPGTTGTSVVNTPKAAVVAGRNGQWQHAKTPSALQLDGASGVTVPSTVGRLVPGRGWTIEAWACPTSGSASRVISYEGPQEPAPTGVTPSYVLGTTGAPALRYGPYTPGTGVIGAYVTVSAAEKFGPAATNGFTWEAWVRPAGPPCPASGSGYGSVVQVVDIAVPAVPQCRLALDKTSTPVFGYRVGTVGAAAEAVLSGPDALPADIWSHVAVVGELADQKWTLTLYVDGKVAKTTTGVTLYPRGTDAPTVTIGTADTTNVSMFGSIAEVRYWNAARDQAELQATMRTSLPGQLDGLYCYWKLDEATTGPYKNSALATGGTYDGKLQTSTSQTVTADPCGVFLSMVAGIGGTPAVEASAFLLSTHWNHLAAVYRAPGALSLNPSGFGNGLEYGVCSSPAGLTIGEQATIEAWVQMKHTAHFGQTVVSQWEDDKGKPAFRLAVDHQGKPFCYFMVEGGSEKRKSFSVESKKTKVTDGKPHHIAVTFAVTTESAKTRCTATMYVDGAFSGMKHVEFDGTAAQAVQSDAPICVGLGRPADPATGPLAIESQRPFRGTITGLRFWSVALDATGVRKARRGLQQADTDDGVSAAWWFGEDEGKTATDTVSHNTFALTHDDLWAALGELATLTCYGNGVEIGVTTPAADKRGYLKAAQQCTIGGYLDQQAIAGGFTGNLAEVRLWGMARTADQLADTMYRGLTADEPGLNAYWPFDGTLDDATAGGANGTMAGSTNPVYVPSLAPVADEGPQVRNVYDGPVTDFQKTLRGHTAAVEYSAVGTYPDGTRYSALRRAYFATTPALHRFTGYGLGELDLVYIGPMQTNPTLVGYIEGAPPVPSENLSRPLYLSVFGYNSYLDATTVKLEQADTTTLTLTSSDYRSFKTSVDVRAGLILGKVKTKSGDDSVERYRGELKIGVQHKSLLDLATQEDEKYVSSWTKTVSDSLGLRGAWETGEPYVNLAVGRRYQPTNFGYAVVESLTADVYAARLRGTGTMVGKVVRPNLHTRDRNIIMFRIDTSYVKNGTLDGKVGLENDLDYPGADQARGSYFKPEEAYALAADIARADSRAQTYFTQFNAESLGRTPLGGRKLPDRAGSPFYDVANSGRFAQPSRGIANRYVWTASGGLRAETEQFSATHERTYIGLRDYTHLTGIQVSFELKTPQIGGYGTVDALFGGQIKVQIGKTGADTDSLALTVTNNCDPMLQGYDPVAKTYTDTPCPGKVDTYRFMTFYLPPSAGNKRTLLDKVVDQNWLDLSSDPDAVALRGVRGSDDKPWRVLHRVTYVSRVPPASDTNADQTVARDPGLAVSVEDNPLLAKLIDAALNGATTPTPAEIGGAVATVLAPIDVNASSTLGGQVPWWAAFLAATRKTDPDEDAVALMNRILHDTQVYMQAGYAAGVLPLPVPKGEVFTGEEATVPAPRSDSRDDDLRSLVSEPAVPATPLAARSN
ncbi:LamG domain-containing protein [Amycolatopsis sp. CA-126428]|uniref:LamG domain-containing protein n=1 Tax=Amycolatopsis sp. CA-126428 TaxID=2073158 RepID=UPI000CD2676A|nr:LamG domain-containing protein [Amycolatopsis sp. CA-126428]